MTQQLPDIAALCERYGVAHLEVFGSAAGTELADALEALLAVSYTHLDVYKRQSPAFVVLAGQDVLHDEVAAYAARLATEARATLRVWPGQIHGFVSMGRVIPEAAEALTAIAEAWRGFDPGFGSPAA